MALADMSDDELEREQQRLTAERQAVLAAARDVAAEIERRHVTRQRAALEAKLADLTPPDPDSQTIEPGDVASLAEVFTPGEG